jgi:integrase/recombinase XerD
MTPLRQRVIDAMVLRGLSPRTQESYADAIYGMAKHYRRDPAQCSAQQVEAYLLHLINERHLSYSTMNQAACAARFLYEKVLGRERELFPIAIAEVAQKQPELLAREEIARLFANCFHPVWPASTTLELAVLQPVHNRVFQIRFRVFVLEVEELQNIGVLECEK